MRRIREAFQAIERGGSPSGELVADLRRIGAAVLARTPLARDPEAADDLVAELLARYVEEARRGRGMSGKSDGALRGALEHRFRQLAAETGPRWSIVKSLRAAPHDLEDLPAAPPALPTSLLDGDRLSTDRIRLMPELPRARLFTSESVAGEHPDKLADRISDAILGRVRPAGRPWTRMRSPGGSSATPATTSRSSAGATWKTDPRTAADPPGRPTGATGPLHGGPRRRYTCCRVDVRHGHVGSLLRRPRDPAARASGRTATLESRAGVGGLSKMTEIIRKLEDAFRDIGVRIGQQLAERMLAEARAGGQAARRRHAPDYAGRPPPSKPKLLPGLSGRRRRPGEAPPLCGRAGCGKPSRTRGYCQTHYVQWLKAGDMENHAAAAQGA